MQTNTAIPALPTSDKCEDWADRHNRAVAYPSATEAAHLRLYDGARAAFVAFGLDGYGAPEVAIPTIQAARAALNFDTGRLDAGTLEGYLYAMASALGVE